MTKLDKLNRLLKRETKRNPGKFVAVDVDNLKVVAIDGKRSTVFHKAKATGHRYQIMRDNASPKTCVAL